MKGRSGFIMRMEGRGVSHNSKNAFFCGALVVNSLRMGLMFHLYFYWKHYKEKDQTNGRA